jgi:putative DNA primase/helicase
VSSPPPTREDIPQALLEYDQWLCWRAEERDGKTTKIPIDPTSAEFASTTDPETWTNFETAREQVQFGQEDGLGFVFTESDPIVGVDLDDCRDSETGQPEEWAKDVIKKLDSFTEVSPSGTGYHVLVAGSLPEGRNRKGELELYETARFFTVTADHVDGTPEAIKNRDKQLAAVYDEYLVPDEPDNSGSDLNRNDEQASRSFDDSELVQKAKNAANGEKFEALYRGSTSGYESQSEADMALCSLLAFWTGGDARQMDRLFRDSGLMREKWDEQHFADGSTYGEKTIERAIAGTSEFYEPSGDATKTSTQPEQPTSESPNRAPRERERLDRIEELEQRLSEVLEEKAELEAELEKERTRRKALEAELEEERESDGSLFNWR